MLIAGTPTAFGNTPGIIGLVLLGALGANDHLLIAPDIEQVPLIHRTAVPKFSAFCAGSAPVCGEMIPKVVNDACRLKLGADVAARYQPWREKNAESFVNIYSLPHPDVNIIVKINIAVWRKFHDAILQV